MDDQSAESVGLRIVAAIGRDGLYITSADKERHFDGASFVAFYGGQLFLTLVTAAASQFWDKLGLRSWSMSLGRKRQAHLKPFSAWVR